MRVPGTKIYRAFEELDRFSDEQCERFVAAAQRPAWQSGMRQVLCAVVAVVITVPGTFCVSAVWEVLFPSFRRGGEGMWTAFALAVTALPLAAGLLGSLLLRDWMLRRLVRRVIGTRGVCRGCGYRLLGLPVSASCQVRCPECGEDSDVDPSLGELAVGADGVRTFANVE